MAHRRPSGLFELDTVKDRDSPCTKKPQDQIIQQSWDPWPVKRFVKNDVFWNAQRLVREYNSRSITQCKNITLLPASGNIPLQQRGSVNFRLYSFRSPHTPPMKVHLWQTSRAEVMARQGSQTSPLADLMESFGGAARKLQTHGVCDHYLCWKDKTITANWLNGFPKRLHATIHERWWRFNGFLFFKLPPELREQILWSIMEPVAEPFGAICSRLGLPHQGKPKRHALTHPSVRLALVTR